MVNPEVLRLLGSSGRIGKPKRSAEWDWYWQLNRRQKTILRNDALGGEAELDVVAGANHMTPDELGAALVAACEVIRDRTSVAMSCYDDAVLIQDLVGPDEVCEWLGVERNTLVQWRRRPTVRFPVPLFELSGMPIWPRGDVEKWALDTGRLELDTGETF